MTAAPSLSSAWPSHPELQAQELSEMLDAVKSLIIPFVEAGTHAGPAGTTPASKASKGTASPSSTANGHSGEANGSAAATSGKTRGLVDVYSPQELAPILKLNLPDGEGIGKDGLMQLIQQTLDYSVNTWDQGFMDKLYNSTNAVGVISELLLGVLNTNVHVYKVSPFLTLVEKHVTARLASLIGFPASTSGGIAQPGGSASNSSSVVVARNTLYPETKRSGIAGKRYTLFTSAHGHYSIEKAAQCFGFGSEAVIPVPVDSVGRMRPEELERLVKESKERGEVPFYVNATAGTTVLGSYDPFVEISAVAKRHNMWMHVDGSWGGAVLFSEQYRASRLQGVELADSMAITPHKMLAVPMTSSFLIVRDMKHTHAAMTLPAGYLYHQAPTEDVYDLGDLVPQCGRKGDALKLYLSWAYYGTAHLGRAIEQGYARSNHLLSLLSQPSRASLFRVVSPQELPCWQVCFYYVPPGTALEARSKEENTELTANIVQGLVRRGFMVDYAPGEWGKHFRVVVHPHKTEETLERLVDDIVELGEEYGKA